MIISLKNHFNDKLKRKFKKTLYIPHTKFENKQENIQSVNASRSCSMTVI